MNHKFKIKQKDITYSNIVFKIHIIKESTCTYLCLRSVLITLLSYLNYDKNDYLSNKIIEIR